MENIETAEKIERDRQAIRHNKDVYCKDGTARFDFCIGWNSAIRYASLQSSKDKERIAEAHDRLLGYYNSREPDVQELRSVLTLLNLNEPVVSKDKEEIERLSSDLKTADRTAYTLRSIIQEKDKRIAELEKAQKESVDLLSSTTLNQFKDRKLLFDFMGDDPGPTIDFNWLMPVVEKIELLTYGVTIHDVNCYIHTESKGVFTTIVDIDGPTKIEAVYKAVIEFIKWYNQQKAIKTLNWKRL